MNNIIIEKNVSFNNIKTINYYNNDDYNELRKNARKSIVNNYDLKKICLPKHLDLIKSLK